MSAPKSPAELIRQISQKKVVSPKTIRKHASSPRLQSHLSNAPQASSKLVGGDSLQTPENAQTAGAEHMGKRSNSLPRTPSEVNDEHRDLLGQMDRQMSYSEKDGTRTGSRAFRDEKVVHRDGDRHSVEPGRRNSGFMRQNSNGTVDEEDHATALEVGNSQAGLTRDVSYKAAKRSYRAQTKEIIKESKKRFSNRVSGGPPMQAAADNVILAGTLKFRDAFKAWHVRYYELAPGVLHYYKQRRRGGGRAPAERRSREEWFGTINLASCKIVVRPSKKEGYCFKIFQPQGKNIFGAKGVVESLPIATDYIILRSTDAAEGQAWFNAIRKIIDVSYEHNARSDAKEDEGAFVSSSDEDDDDEGLTSESEADDDVERTAYVPAVTEVELLNKDGPVEELVDENRSVIWALLKQVKVGMDLSKVTLPTFILEPRSFLELLSDYFYHSNVLQIAARTHDDPMQRMIEVVRWYLSGFYKTSKELKKPYNPILGEIYRCKFRNNDGTRTTYIAEQVSHYPPISAWTVANRKHGWNLTGTVKPVSRFSGNSAASVLVGAMKLHLQELDEVYTITLPSAIVKGIFFGTMMVELGGTVKVENMNNGLVAEVDFKQKPMIGGQYCAISGGIRLDGTQLYTIDGRWDGKINITELKTKYTNVLWQAKESTMLQRLVKYDVAKSDLTEWDSQKLWEKVSTAITNKDQVAATDEKNKLEEAQREAHKARVNRDETYAPRLFNRVLGTDRADGLSDEDYYVYRYFNLVKWDAQRECYDFEKDGIISTRLRSGELYTAHDAPAVTQRLLQTNTRHKDELTVRELRQKDMGLRQIKHSSQPHSAKTIRRPSIESRTRTANECDFKSGGSSGSLSQVYNHRRTKSAHAPGSMQQSVLNCEQMLQSLQADVKELRKRAEHTYSFSTLVLMSIVMAVLMQTVLVFVIN